MKQLCALLTIVPLFLFSHECCPEITPCALGTAAEYGLFIKGEFLYWKSSEDGLSYTKIITPISPPQFPTPFFDAEVIDMEFDWEPAFRLGAGATLCHDCFDLYAAWTFYKTDPKTSITRKSPQLSLFVTQDLGHDTAQEGAPLATKASAHWDMTFNTLDLELGRHYWVSCALSLRPFLGLKGVWIAQTFDVKYEDIFFVEQREIGEFLGTTRFHGKGDFWGVGPRLGVNTKWHLGWGFSFLADAAGSILSGCFDSSGKVVDNNPAIDPSHVVQHIEQDSPSRLRPAAELLAALEWGRCFGSTYLYISAGYELNYYFEQMEIPTPGNPFPSGDLTFHGLTLSFRFDF